MPTHETADEAYDRWRDENPGAVAEWINPAFKKTPRGIEPKTATDKICEGLARGFDVIFASPPPAPVASLAATELPPCSVAVGAGPLYEDRCSLCGTRSLPAFAAYCHNCDPARGP